MRACCANAQLTFPTPTARRCPHGQRRARKLRLSGFERAGKRGTPNIGAVQIRIDAAHSGIGKPAPTRVGTHDDSGRHPQHDAVRTQRHEADPGRRRVGSGRTSAQAIRAQHAQYASRTGPVVQRKHRLQDVREHVWVVPLSDLAGPCRATDVHRPESDVRHLAVSRQAACLQRADVCFEG